jgi:hypothetical protein
MQQIVAANHFRIGVGENGETIPCLLNKITRNLGRVDANRYRPDALGRKLTLPLLDAS